MKTKLNLILAILILCIRAGYAQNPVTQEPEHKYFVGSTLFVVANLLPEPPRYIQLNFGYRTSKVDFVSIEAITWQYSGPLGRPYGPDHGAKRSNFPGHVRAYGVGVAYGRFLWKGLYAAVHATPLFQRYLDLNYKQIQTGFQLFNTLRFGYNIEMFNNRLFIQPSVAFTNWPVNTNLPESFQVEEDKWPNYFLFEPGLHIGINL